MSAESHGIASGRLAAVGAAAAALVGSAVTAVVPLSSSENLVFRVRAGSHDVVLRLTATTRRTASDLDAELAWLRHLEGCGVGVVRPLTCFVAAPISLGEEPRYRCVVFEFAGPALPGPDGVDEALLAALGRLLADLHRAGAPRPASAPGRWYWKDARNYDLGLLGLSHADHAAAAAVLNRAASSIHGDLLVHADLGLRNLVVGENSLTAIDFDDCCWASAEYDIAATLYDVLVDHRLGLPPVSAAAALMGGYRQVAGRQALRDGPIRDALAALVVERAITAHRVGPHDEATHASLHLLLAGGGLPSPLAQLWG